MLTFRPIALALGACLLPSCVTPPPPAEMAMQPVLRVRHSSDQTAITYYRLGKYHQEHGNLDLARDAYVYSIRLDGRQLEARNALAAVYSAQGRLDEAKTLLLQLLAEYPAVAHPYNNLGYVYYLQGDYDAAVTTLQHALALDAGNARVRNNLNMATAALASHGKQAPVALEHAPAASEARDALSKTPGTASVEHKEGTAVADNITSPSPMRFATRLTEPTVAAAPSSRPPERAPTQPQARMELVQVVPNVYELKQLKTARQKPAVAPALTEWQGERAIMAITTSPPAVAAVGKVSRVEIANGNGVTGMAKRIKRALGRQGIAVSRLTNERPFRQQDTKIQYRLGYEQEAAALKKALRGYALLAQDNGLSERSDVRLVLGKDAIGRMALIEGLDGDLQLVLNEAAH